MFILLFSFFLFAKEPVSLQPGSVVPKAPKKGELVFKDFQDVKLKELKPPEGAVSCKSRGGVEHKPGTANYQSCMEEGNRYTPPGYVPGDKNQ